MDEQPGFLVPEPRATLVLDDGEMAGAEIEARLTLSPSLYFAGMDLLGRLSGAGTTKAGMMAVAREVAAFFAAHGLISWNLRDPRTGDSIPATADGAMTLDIRVLSSIFSTWIQWLGNVPLPLPATSPEPMAHPTRLNRRQRRSTAGRSTAATSQKRSRDRTSRSSSASAE